ncbi:MAG: hypothetical protein WCY30_00035 [Candidatus Neomarinimicrobiota bacterium]|jgi:hypothetical protein
MTSTIYAPLVVSGIITKSTNFKEFRIQIKYTANSNIIKDVRCEGVHLKDGSYIIVPYTYSAAIKGRSYEFRVSVIGLDGSESTFSRWIEQTAGDNEFGAISWDNSIEATDHSLIVTVNLVDSPPDFQRIEVYERDSDEDYDAGDWHPDYVYTKTSFQHPWVGKRFDEEGDPIVKYFFFRAYDRSGNPSELSEPQSGSINIILPGDMDTIPPDNTIGLLILSEFD